MKRHQFEKNDPDIYPAFTDFIISVLIVIVLFMLGIFFTNITRDLLAAGNEFNSLKNKQLIVRKKLGSIPGILVQEDGNLQRIVLQVDKEGKGGILFDSGQAALKSEGQIIIKRIADVLESTKSYYKSVQVEGHTDNRPINSMQYRSNWELSAARAGAVVDFLLETGNLEPWRFSANGRGEYRPYNVPESEMEQTGKLPDPTGSRLKKELPDYVVRHNLVTTAPLNRRIEIILIY